ncbi:ABC transporter permease [Nocardiopsis ansamitocini]|uniref:ABC-2 type transporter transmembrane domain-containing protein n=1 Tax=Nocardiopsis ansamitocini TaxID=1670832 RepID=A0A9W6PAL0_9ACTN|nr:ABC transporter permease [Nocardiopsis ansamitocini]GLU50018.1 hypothetical protein Nans01_43690 [Nocardiopsis ansamitocini]
MTKPVTIGLLNLRRVFRDRTNIFFVILLPLLMVFTTGLMFGQDSSRLGVTGAAEGPLAERLVASLEGTEHATVERVGSEEALRDLVERGAVDAGLIVPEGYDERVREGDAEVSVLSRPDDWGALNLTTWVRSMVSQEATLLGAARFAEAESGGDFDTRLDDAENADIPGIEVAAVTTGESVFPEDVSQYALAAPPILLLFTFLTSLTTAIGIVQTRQSGIARRMYSTPTGVGTIVFGEALGRFVITLTQALLILFGSALLFGVVWGDLVATAAVLTAFCLVGSGAAMLLGSVFKTEGSAVSAALGIGLAAAAAGGTMVPLDAFSGVVRAAAYVTPHAWGYEAFSEIVRHGGGIIDVLPQIAVLLGYAAVLFGLGAWRLQKVITR